MLWGRRSGFSKAGWRHDFQDPDPDGRMRLLEQLIDGCLGPRKRSYGEPSTTLERTAMPDILERFYRHAGRWPMPHPSRSPVVFERPEDSYFYGGISSAHMATCDSLKLTAGRLKLFFEQSGNWVAVTDQRGTDPPVWVSDSGFRDEQAAGVVSAERLSGWLISQVLAAIAWESGNSFLCGTTSRAVRNSDSPAGAEGLAAWFLANSLRAQRLYTSRAGPAELSGTFYLFRGSLLVHETASLLRFAALTPAAAAQLRSNTARSDTLE